MRLIDANTLKAEFAGNFNGGYYTVPEINAQIDTAPTIGGWISVKDRLPEEGEEVLVWNDEGFCYVDEIKNGMWKIPGVYSGNTHWMPLPEPPKEGT